MIFLGITKSIAVILASLALTTHATDLKWEKLPPLPDALGFAGPFAGVSHNVLIVAGGANFPEKMPWEGGKKIWHDSLFVLEKPDGQWRTAGKLPRPLGYGVTINHGQEIICIGGSDATRHYDAVFSLSWRNGQIETKTYPSLPEPRANMCGALIGKTIYIVGGTERPDATNAANSFFALDLSQPQKGWRTLPPLPGPGRIFAVANAHHNAFYLFSGAALKPGPDGKPTREWLRDAYCYTPRDGWKRIADLPRVAVAAPSPALVVNDQLLILGGDDGSQVDTAPTKHKGFSRDVLAYGPKKDQWEQLATAPFALVTTTTVAWKNRIIIPGGEIRPGIRSTEVWSLKTK